jgi:hypothetical protein
MRKEYAITTIKRLFLLKKQQDQLSELGISITNFTDQYSSLLEESIAVMYGKTEKEFENILENLILFLDQVEPGKVENFVSWLEFEFGKDLSLGDKVSLNGNIFTCSEEKGVPGLITDSGMFFRFDQIDTTQLKHV